jgi:MHS family proline/betaine transporter-like MFS transporter
MGKEIMSFTTTEESTTTKGKEKRKYFVRRPRRLRVSDVTVVEKSVLKRAIAGTVVGNLMEWYDVGIYGYLAVTIGQAFLSDAPGTVQRLFSLGVFAVTFIARPLGGIILGQLGDRLGRQKILAFTLLAMATATLLIGVLPDFSSAGAWAPIALIVLKLVQGFSTGGEYAGASTLITEYAPDKHRGLYASLLDVGSYLGFASGAALVSLLQLTIASDAMLSWGWRIPFILALPLALIALYFRTQVEDTPVFRQAQEAAEKADTSASGDSQSSEHGVMNMVRSYWRELLISFTLVTAANTLGYTLTTYMPTYLTTTLHHDAAHGTLLTIPVLLVLAACIPLTGALSDAIGRKKVLLIGAGSGVVLVVPAFLLMEMGTTASTLGGLFVLAIPVAFMVANLASSLPAMFPTSSRYGGMGFSYNLAVAIFGGTAPLIMEALVSATGNPLAPALWIVATSLCGIVAVAFLKESARQPMPGAMPTVSTKKEAHELVATQDENPDLDVPRIMAQAAREGALASYA